MAEHLFYHADRAWSLQEFQTLGVGADGLSTFGRTYAEAMSQDSRSWTPAEERECLSEIVRLRNPNFANRPSRFRVLFASLTIEDAIRHGQETKDEAAKPARIFEIYAATFTTLDRVWLDYESAGETRIKNLTQYWWGEISNHCPATGPRISPRLEVLVSLPARVGRMVART